MPNVRLILEQLHIIQLYPCCLCYEAFFCWISSGSTLTLTLPSALFFPYFKFGYEKQFAKKAP